jgi:hypothetical protein
VAATFVREEGKTLLDDARPREKKKAGGAIEQINAL